MFYSVTHTVFNCETYVYRFFFQCAIRMIFKYHKKNVWLFEIGPMWCRILMYIIIILLNTFFKFWCQILGINVFNFCDLQIISLAIILRCNCGKIFVHYLMIVNISVSCIIINLNKLLQVFIIQNILLLQRNNLFFDRLLRLRSTSEHMLKI